MKKDSTKNAQNFQVDNKIVKWVRTNDALGFKPNFEILCPFCEINMHLRRSALIEQLVNNNYYPKLAPTCEYMYKCPSCAHCIYFFVEAPYMDASYHANIFVWRRNHNTYIPDIITWEEEDKIKERLKALGYWGGDAGD